MNVRETLSQLGEFFDAQLDGCIGMGLLYLVVHFSYAVFGATYTRMLEFNANGSPKSCKPPLFSLVEVTRRKCVSSSCTTVENGAKLIVAVKIGLFYIEIRMYVCVIEKSGLSNVILFFQIYEKIKSTH